MGSRRWNIVLFVPDLIGQDDQGEQECNAVGEVDGKIVGEDAVDEPEQGAEGEQGVH